MKKKGRVVKIFFLVFLLITILFNLYMMFFVPYSVTGRGTSSSGIVSFTILGLPNFDLLSPKNITYNFSASDPLILDLNGTSTDAADSWIYHLYDLKHDRWARENISFGPVNSYFINTTFGVVRWGNTLIVDAWFGQRKVSKNVTFYVNVSNSAPILGSINNPIYVCERRSLLYLLNATDLDEEDLTYQLVDSSGRFGMEFLGRDESINFFRLFSGLLSKGPTGAINVNQRSVNYPISIEVSDLEYSDTAFTNITVIEINNPPVITPNLTVQTLWNRGENSTYFVDINFSDIETSLGYGSLTPTLTIRNNTGNLVNLFNITPQGIINFTATNATPVGNYNVSVCVTDYGLLNPHPMINSICNQNGGNITTCDSFQLTITNQNRPPTIVNHSPENLQINATSIELINFNATTYDPDGTTPDFYWYVDGVLKQYNEGSLFNKFNYSFGCGSSGNHNVKLNITDGELSDSVQWNISLSVIPCSTPEGSKGGGGGGGGGSPVCSSKLICNPWTICQHAKSSLDLGILSGVSYRTIEDQCKEYHYEESRCGYQIRSCTDFNNCSFSANKPSEIQSCLYTANPTCNDGIQNCHDSSCELLIDCGGPCKQCPSCSDKVKNQGEEGIDCGGPCPWKCVPEVPLLKRSKTIYIFLIIILIIIIFVVIKLTRVLWYKRAIASSRKPNV
jgi:hypothetical protein